LPWVSILKKWIICARYF